MKKRGRPKGYILSGISREVLLSLYYNQKYYSELLKDIKAGPTSLSNILKILKEESLIEDKYIQLRRVLSLTEKGKEIAKYILMTRNFIEKKEIEEVKEIQIDRKKWILLLLYLANEIKGTTRLMKYLFLMKKEYEIENEYNFSPYFYGPFSYEVFEDIEKLEKIGLIEIERKIHEPKIAGDWEIFKKYSLTEKGKEIAEKIYNELDNVTKVKLNELIERFNKYTLAGLISYVYNKYPEECKEVR